MPNDPELAGVQLVFVGSFNPAIFQPAWLAAHELIREEDAESAEIQLIHPDVVAFTLDWAVIEVTRERCQLGSTTTAEAAEPVRDLALGIFEILAHTPIRAAGINSDAHYRIDSEEHWHRIGHTLAPDDRWADILERPGTRSLVMEGARADGHNGYIRVAVEPSVRIHPGIYIAVNDHHQLAGDEVAVGSAREAIETVRDRWTASLEIGPAAAGRVLSIE